MPDGDRRRGTVLVARAPSVGAVRRRRRAADGRGGRGINHLAPVVAGVVVALGGLVGALAVATLLVADGVDELAVLLRIAVSAKLALHGGPPARAVVVGGAVGRHAPDSSGAGSARGSALGTGRGAGVRLCATRRGQACDAAAAARESAAARPACGVAAAAGASRGATGTATHTSVPPPGAGTTSRRPPSASTRSVQ